MSTPIRLDVSSDFVTPSEAPRHGDRRLVRMLPSGLPGQKGQLFPALWISPYEIYDEDLKEKIKIALMLVSKGPPKPEIWSIRIPSAAIEKFPMAPVEW